MDWKTRIKDSPLSSLKLPGKKEESRPVGSALSGSLSSSILNGPLVSFIQEPLENELGHEQSSEHLSKIGNIGGI